MDGRNKQEIRVRIDVSVTVCTYHDMEHIEAILMRGIYNSFPNNPLVVNNLCYAEERDVHFDTRVDWKSITEEYKEKNENH